MKTRMTRISVTKTDPDISTLGRKVEQGDLILRPLYQRSPGIWTPRQRSRLIESLLVGIPVPPIFVGVDAAGVWEIVDGLQRVSTITGFIANRWPLTNLEFLTEYNMLRYNKMPQSEQRRLLSSSLTVYAVPLDTNKEACNVIFDRINSGTGLNSAERARGSDRVGFLRRMGDILGRQILDVLGLDQQYAQRNREWGLAMSMVMGMLSTWDRGDLYVADVPFANAGANPTAKFTDALRKKVDDAPPEERVALHARAEGCIQRIVDVFDDCAFRKHMSARDMPSSRASNVHAFLQAYIVGAGSEGCGYSDEALREAHRYVCEAVAEPWAFDRGHMNAAVEHFHAFMEGRG